jgi:alpha-beta hydrolase superfamily lysophospholipase
MRQRSPVERALAGLVVVMAVIATLLAGPGPAGAETEYRRGPNPTEASVTAATGPFATASTTVPESVAGFGGGVIHYPTDTSQGTFGAVAVAPGFLASSSHYAWLGPRLASQGFVVFLIDTDARRDLPPARGSQLLAALDYLVTSSSVRTRVDAGRLAVAGHSMGGGGTLEAADDRPGLQAAIPLQPWHTVKSWPNVRVPTMIIGAELDTTAPPANHSEPFYTSLTAASDRAYLELNDAEHRVSTSPDVTTARYMISWLKRYVDNDTRYEPFLCPNPGAGGAIEEYRDTCPGPA